MLVGNPIKGSKVITINLYDHSTQKSTVTDIHEDNISLNLIKQNISWMKEIRDYLYIVEDNSAPFNYFVSLNQELPVGTNFGGKATNLNKLIQNGVKVPPGFTLRPKTFADITARNVSLAQRIKNAFDYLKTAQQHKLHTDDLQVYSDYIKEAIMSGTTFPTDLIVEVQRVWDALDNAPVAIRSSATLEDSVDASFAGQQDTILNCASLAEIIRAVKQCWASLYSSRAILYRLQKGIVEQDASISVIIQKMIQSSISGVLFTKNPMNDSNSIVIEAILGLGEPLVSGQVTPDTYYVDRASRQIIDKKMSYQSWMLTDSKDKRVPVHFSGQKLPDNLIQDIIAMALTIETMNANAPQDIEWGVEDNIIYILQARPITTHANHVTVSTSLEVAKALKVLLKGTPSSGGIVSGRVKRITIEGNTNNYASVRKGDIIVCSMTSPDIVPAMRLAAGIVTDQGGVLCHAAIVSREFQIPCITGVGNTTYLEDKMDITIDGNTGTIYKGRVKVTAPTSPSSSLMKVVTISNDMESVKLIIDKPNNAGIFVLSPGKILADLEILHPNVMLNLSTLTIAPFRKKLTDYLMALADMVLPSPVFYTMNDYSWEENRFSLLASQGNTGDINPSLGSHGGFKHSRLGATEDKGNIEALIVRDVIEAKSNFYPILRNFRVPDEVYAFQDKFPEIVDKMWLVISLPHQLSKIKDFIHINNNGIVIDIQNLHQMFLGYDKFNTSLVAEYSSTRSQTLENMIQEAIGICKEEGVLSMVLAEYVSPDVLSAIGSPDGIIVYPNERIGRRI